ncbi:lytic murein transglycosylase [Microbacterium laevaniformans]|uniref:lytic murein transglycosylase n=1 Tax=Microbacterium laevaniformans TaxID=36807 RepID=UPI0019567E25|nr:lytic murein transglycosylase [Microbacterium laevaniformans]MBM7753253.1 membrane-bound lytic murein transglycosylase B [Microbacterium laevaniformans]GLJ65370.1 murein transglycosylase [Microbacterium laevaniformans]
MGGRWSWREGALALGAVALLAVFLGGILTHVEAAPSVLPASPAERPVDAFVEVPVRQDAVAAAPVAGDAVAASSAPLAPVASVDPVWLARVSAATGIPPRALRAYASAQLRIVTEQPSCAIGWNTLAAIGGIESDHGRHGGAVLGEDGNPVPAIRGPALDGDGVAAIADTDGGRWDGDTLWDRAVGPMQFIPDTWSRWGADGNGDGVADPNQIDDAALATARYLCGVSAMTDAAAWRAAVFAYNHLEAYVEDVAVVANRYAASAAAG